MTATLDDLKNIIALSELPVEHLQWIVDRGVYEEYKDGTLIVKTGDPMDDMIFTLGGKMDFYLDVNGKQVHYFTFENDAMTGGVGGLLPYSRLKNSPGFTYAVGHVKLLRLNKQYFHDLEQLNPDLIQRLIGYMTERARAFATTQLQHEKVSALGKLSAGIAHELNNPASAINNISHELTKRLKLNYALTEKLLSCTISPLQIKVIREIVEEKEKNNENKKRLTPLERIEKEDEIEDWLDKLGFKGSRQAAEAFLEFGFTTDDFESIRDTSNNEEFINVIHWLENVLSSQRIIIDLEEASSRIFKLVGAIKSHVHMDRTNDAQCTDIHTDIENTITLLGYKLREKNISIRKNFNENMPQVEAFVGELNQVWTNIIDNAIFALDKNGELTIETSFDKNNATVRIIDNGPGIPKDILSRIFDPFFTTKKVGDGTGIGLDLVNRIIKRHNGEIKVNSVPGRTEFAICVPIAQKQKEHEEVKNI